ncbi:MAG: hypothetical protein CO025_01680 [Ignavibacteria bacterium CG_4_9_14_0_2_um_filter_37_13]|nr:MAG: hypothetical protein CO025_01680 [Ignavibacteria bacterium CG_4_9_14_0_2_um_filter_37_13]
MTKKIFISIFLLLVLSSCSTFYNRSENKLAYFQIVYGDGFQNQRVFIMLNDDLHLFLTFAKSYDDFFPTAGHSSTYLPKGKNKLILKRIENRVQSQIYALPNPVDSTKKYIDTLFIDIGDDDSSNMFIDIQHGKIVTKIQKEQFRFYTY